MKRYSDKYVQQLREGEQVEMQSYIDAMNDAEQRQQAMALIQAGNRFDIELRKLRAAKTGRMLQGWDDLG